MFGKLKAAAGDAANNKAATLITTHVEPVMEEIQGYSHLTLQAASSGVTRA